MKIFIAHLGVETNACTAFKAGLGGILEHGIRHCDASRLESRVASAFRRFERNLTQDKDYEMVETVCAFAQPTRHTARAVHLALRDEILADLRAALPVEAVHLILGGVMVADGSHGWEGDLLIRIREMVGPDVPIGAELTLRCHFTDEMRLSADAVVCFGTFPHVDADARAHALHRILFDATARRVRPTTAVFDCRMVGRWAATGEPMAGFVRRMQSFEGRGGVLSVSLGHGVPRGDVAEAGARLWVVTNDDPLLAQTLAEQLGREFWGLRNQMSAPMPSVETLEAACDEHLLLTSIRSQVVIRQSV